MIFQKYPIYIQIIFKIYYWLHIPVGNSNGGHRTFFQIKVDWKIILKRHCCHSDHVNSLFCNSFWLSQCFSLHYIHFYSEIFMHIFLGLKTCTSPLLRKLYTATLRLYTNNWMFSSGFIMLDEMPSCIILCFVFHLFWQHYTCTVAQNVLKMLLINN